MRSVLFSIPLDGRIDLGPFGKVPVFGCGLILALWVLFGLVFLALHVRRSGWKDLGVFTAVVWLAIAAAVFKAPEVSITNHAIPVYGYGMMLFLGFLTSASFAAWRIRAEGADGDIAWDVAMWIFVSGIVGGRTYYVLSHSERFFGADPVTKLPRTIGQILIALVNLPDGGLVLYGGVILAPLAYFYFCRRGRISPLALADLAISSVFVGLLFGRLGCFLHGCCYGDVCALPWGVTFPRGSVPFDALVGRGLLADDQPRSLALHPTQLYDSLNALLLVLLTWLYYPLRRRSGEVLAIGWMLYPINRFLIEFLRSDEPPVFGTPLTGAQWVSVGLFFSGVAFAVWLERQPAVRQPLVAGGNRFPRGAVQKNSSSGAGATAAYATSRGTGSPGRGSAH
jgi:phosphatidylglycerol:prolipoprotein diacylglycerol transferase